MNKKKKKKKKSKAKEFNFRVSDKIPFKTIKTTLKSVIKDKNLILEIDKIVFEINDLVIHTYQFIRL
jgi:hypothetical protein